jgi:hypothetical protein
MPIRTTGCWGAAKAVIGGDTRQLDGAPGLDAAQVVNSATMEISRSRSIGLIVYSSQPASMHFFRSPLIAWAVRAMMAPV